MWCLGSNKWIVHQSQNTTNQPHIWAYYVFKGKMGAAYLPSSRWGVFHKSQLRVSSVHGVLAARAVSSLLVAGHQFSDCQQSLPRLPSLWPPPLLPLVQPGDDGLPLAETGHPGRVSDLTTIVCFILVTQNLHPLLSGFIIVYLFTQSYLDSPL